MHNQIVFERVNKNIVLLILSIFVTRKNVALKNSSKLAMKFFFFWKNT